MPILKNSRWEAFAHRIAAGEPATRAYRASGYGGSGAEASASRLLKNAKVAPRVEELRQGIVTSAVERSVITKTFVIEQLLTVVKRCMQEKPVTDPSGKPTGEYTFQAMAALRGLELLGKETGMFIDRKRLETRKLSDLSTEELESIVQDGIAQYGEEIVLGETTRDSDAESISRKKKVVN
jgi:hypothetical protein